LPIDGYVNNNLSLSLWSFVGLFMKNTCLEQLVEACVFCSLPFVIVCHDLIVSTPSGGLIK
jgi:hypothetical protein